MAKMNHLPKPLAPADWDFRGIPEFAIPIATEYEFARSSRFAKKIERWLKSDFQSVPAHCWILRLPQLKAAGLLQYPKRSCFQKLADSGESMETYDVTKHLKLEALVVSRWADVNKAPVTVGEAIRRLIEAVEAPELRFGTLDDLGAGALPAPIRKHSLSRIALAFERFPEPFLDTFAKFGEEYIRRRIRPSVRSVPVFEIDGPRRVDYLPLVGEVPGLEHHEFLIDWNFSLTEISKSFQNWVNKRLESRRGTKARHARLKWLAAFRLHQAGIKYSQTTKLMEARLSEAPINSRWDVMPKYTQQADWSEAIQKADEMLKGDFVRIIRSDYAFTEKLIGRIPPEYSAK